MEGLREKLGELFTSFQASDPESKTVEENWTQFKGDLHSTIKEYIPQKALNRKKSLPWCNANIRRLIRQKQQDWQKFRQLRKWVHKEMQLAHQRYINSLLDIDKGNCDSDRGPTKPGMTKRFWQYIKAKRRDSSGIAVLKSNGKEFTNPKQKADILNNQYNSVFTVEDPVLPTLPESVFPDMPDIIIDTNGIIKLLEGLNPSKANGPDLIPTRVLKDAATAVAPYLCFIFQQSINSGDVPSDWKHANVTAIFKKGSRLEAANYRPVSLTSVPCKLLEHIIYHNIMAHLDAHNILVDYQHGFRSCRSCETQLVNTVDHLAHSINYRNQTDLLILDFSKAFDKVAHKRLLLKLDYYGIRGLASAWIQSWLIGRTQQVVLEGHHSEKSIVNSGVPQGTVLGPLCFLLYINDMGNNISSNLKLFADDTLLYGLVHDANDAISLQQDLDRLVSWAQIWQMEFHPSKCYVLRICRTNNPIIYPYSMLGHILKAVDHQLYLGITLTETLSWKTHILNVKNKANKTLGFIKRNLHLCP